MSRTVKDLPSELRTARQGRTGKGWTRTRRFRRERRAVLALLERDTWSRAA